MNRSHVRQWLLAVLVLSLTASAVKAQEAPAQLSEIIPNQYIVVLKEGVDPDAVSAELAKGRGLAVMKEFRRAIRGFSALVPPGRLAALRSDPRVVSVSADRTAHASVQTLPEGINRIDAEPGAAANDGSGVNVAVIDTGIDAGHPDLAVNFAGGKTFVTSAETTTVGGLDDQGHGTHVAGTIAAVDNAADVVGVGPKISLWSVKVLDNNGSGSFSDIIAGIDWLLDTTAHPPIRVANMSLGATCSVCTENSTDPTLQALHAAIQNATAHGIAFVVAAGNESADAKTTVPAAYDEVITVSALTDTDGQPGGNGPALLIPGLGKFDDDTFARFSNYGADVDVIAPGVNILSTKLGGGATRMSGTSMAAPHVAGTAALYAAANSSASVAEIRQALISTGECANGAEATTGCATVWKGDPDAVAEPLINASRVSSSSPAQPAVLATLSADKANYVSGQDAASLLTAVVKDEKGQAISGLDAAAFSTTVDGTSVTLAYAAGAVAGSYQASLSLSGMAVGAHAVMTQATDGRGLNGSGGAGFNVVAPGPTMHVADIAMSISKQKAVGKWKAAALINIVDGSGLPVGGAAVAGEWKLNGAFLNASQGTTGADGKISLASSAARASSGNVFSFTVTSVVKSGSAYDPSLNVKTSNTIAVP